MPAGSDVIVIGGGIIGCVVASELAARGVKVRLIERRTLAAGATQASAGMLAPFIEGHNRAEFLALGIRSLAMYDALVGRLRESSGMDIDYRRNGSLEVATTEAAAERLRAAAVEGGAAREWLGARAAADAEPALGPGIGGALRTAAHGYVAVEALTRALAESARRAGTVIETGVDVVSIRRHGTALAVEGSDATLRSADRVVVAAGSWSGDPRWGREAGDVHPVRGQIVRVRTAPSAIRHVVWGPDCYVVPWQDGTVLVGATEELAGFDERVTGDGVARLLAAGSALLPALGDATFIEARAGLRPATGDGLPIIGPSAELSGVIYATGHFRNGILLAPLTAHLVAGCLFDEPADPALALLRPGRASLSIS